MSLIYSIPKHIAGDASEDDYSGFPPTLLGFGGDEMMSGDAPDYEAAFKRSHARCPYNFLFPF